MPKQNASKTYTPAGLTERFSIWMQTGMLQEGQPAPNQSGWYVIRWKKRNITSKGKAIPPALGYAFWNGLTFSIPILSENTSALAARAAGRRFDTNRYVILGYHQQSIKYALWLIAKGLPVGDTNFDAVANAEQNKRIVKILDSYGVNAKITAVGLIDFNPRDQANPLEAIRIMARVIASNRTSYE